MDLMDDGRDIHVTLRNDVWQIGEPGTLTLTRVQARKLVEHLTSRFDSDATYVFILDSQEEDG